jgi:hypothetical protein
MIYFHFDFNRELAVLLGCNLVAAWLLLRASSGTRKASPLSDVGA